MHDWLLIKYLACLKKIDNCQDLCGSVVLDDERSRYFLLLNIFFDNIQDHVDPCDEEIQFLQII